MESSSYNCMICAHECDNTSQSIKISTIILDRFKICDTCLNLSDPADDYQQVKNILDAYKTSYK